MLPAKQSIPPHGHPNRAGLLNNLGNRLYTQFSWASSLDSLDRAIAVATAAVNASPKAHPDCARYLNNLANSYGLLFEKTNYVDHLDYAIEALKQAAASSPRDHPDKASTLNSLGNWLRVRYEQSRKQDDLDNALECFRKSYNCSDAPSFLRIRSLQQSAHILASQSTWTESSFLFEKAVNLLHMLGPRSLKHTDRQNMLKDFSGLASTAAATSLMAGKQLWHAVQLLDIGRGIIASLLMDMRGDISDLQSEHPSLASEFISLRDQLDSPTDKPFFPGSGSNTHFRESQLQRRREIERKFDDLLQQIRSDPQFKNFLLPPTEIELMAAGDPDPIIIINLSQYRCDAFILQPNQVRTVPLPTNTIETVEYWSRNLQNIRRIPSSMVNMLGPLWRTIAQPIFTHLASNFLSLKSASRVCGGSRQAYSVNYLSMRRVATRHFQGRQF